MSSLRCRQQLSSLETAGENVKSSVLEHAASDKVWSTPPSRIVGAVKGHMDVSGGVNDAISSLQDHLDNLVSTSNCGLYQLQ
jgi:hypothetical protein